MNLPLRLSALLTVTSLLATLLPSTAAAQTAVYTADPSDGGPAGTEAAPVVETRLVIRALSNDAKLIGSGVGGARITVRHADTGALLAEGVQQGGTGDTDAILAPRARDASPFDTEGAAAFRTSLPLDRPTPVEITAEGPLGTPHATQRTSTTVLLMPGHHIEGDGVVLVLHGFTVELLDAPGKLPPGGDVTVRVKVTMLCGCPTEPGGRWDSSGWRMQVALLGPLDDGGPLAPAVVAPLEFSGETSVYRATLTLPSELPEGAWTLRAVVADPVHVNAGLVERIVRVGR